PDSQSQVNGITASGSAVNTGFVSQDLKEPSMKTLTFLLVAALAAICGGQQDCSRGACYPPLGDLLIGRERQLIASSTCGLYGTEVYCTPFGQFKMKCCPCDSQNPAGPHAHTIQNVLPYATAEKWWQSKKDVSPVTLQLDLQQMFHVDNVMLSFKGPRPDALVIERTKDFGRTWQPTLYMATDCSSAFPWVTTGMPRNLDNTYCYTLPTTSPNTYQDQRVYYHPLHQYTNVNHPREHKIEEVSGFTGLRVNLTQFGNVPRLPGRSPSRFYALKELKVMGSCFCHGHANRCLPDPNSNYLPTEQINGVCECQHNTAGPNCERCDDFYNDLPWRPAERDNTHTCKRCECNNHATRCHFDQEVYELSSRRSGGVCDGCLHNTAGPQCERCAPNYYRNPRSTMQRPDACLPCQCEGAGSVSGRQCDPVTGQCICKANVEGARCDRCKAGYYGLNAANSLGCSACQCDSRGTVPGVCDDCPSCPSCFFTLDAGLQNLTRDTDRLASRLDTQGGTPGMDIPATRFGRLENILWQINNALQLPTPSETELVNNMEKLLKLQAILMTLNTNMKTTDPTPEMQRELDELQAQLAKIQLIYNTKKNASFSDSNYAGALAAIRDAYNKSVQAEERAVATGETVNKSAGIRDDIMNRTDRFLSANIKSLQTLGDSLGTWPNLTSAAAQICGRNRTSPCTPKDCADDLCPADAAAPCAQGELCASAVSQANRTKQDTDDVKMKLQQLNDNITQTYTQIQDTQDTIGRVRLSTDELANRILVTRDDLDYELKDMKDFVKKLKEYLSSPFTDPAEVQRISEAVLGLKLPEGADSLRRKLQELQDLASKLPNSSKVLEEAEPKLDQARRLLKDAEKVRVDHVAGSWY
ncbi:hypothetical protein NFI96_017445, partial [Prochilodus magdalenae]